MTEKQKRYARLLIGYNLLMELFPFTTAPLDGEVWEWVRGYKGLYKVSNYFRVMSLQNSAKVILKPFLNPNGYLYVSLCKNGTSHGYRLHRLVAQAFLPNPDGKVEVDHINGDRLNCCASNLRWVTRRENIRYAKERHLAENLAAEENLPAVMTINNVRGYLDDNGTAWLNAEDVARGLGFVDVHQKKDFATSGEKYETVRWARVNQYLAEFGFSKEVGKEDYLPENMFYRLAMKAKNAVAEKFQAKVADDILPTLRKTGKYELNPQKEKSHSSTSKLTIREKIQLLDKYIEMADNPILRDELIRQASIILQ